ncbi:hypothetical protein [Streptomyces puniciscabiei]|uniref:hypothetical protein n=1 Tax=Streptomyces puniciscabiei TaxID=164348 RepID=UPI001150FA2F|nr:hypothetical protein [Streptomyces puniciscabiei]
MPAQPEELQEEPEPTVLSPWPTRRRFPERTGAKHATIHALLTAGHSKRSVVRQLDMTLNTILCFSHTTTPEEKFTGPRPSVNPRRHALVPHPPRRPFRRRPPPALDRSGHLIKVFKRQMFGWALVSNSSASEFSSLRNLIAGPDQDSTIEE